MKDFALKLALAFIAVTFATAALAQTEEKPKPRIQYIVVLGIGQGTDPEPSEAKHQAESKAIEDATENAFQRCSPEYDESLEGVIVRLNGKLTELVTPLSDGSSVIKHRHAHAILHEEGTVVLVLNVVACRVRLQKEERVASSLPLDFFNRAWNGVTMLRFSPCLRQVFETLNRGLSHPFIRVDVSL
jgi:hypothetical protein